MTASWKSEFTKHEGWLVTSPRTNPLHGGISLANVYVLGCPPSQDSSHHQDYEPFLVGDSYEPSFPLLLGGGTTQCMSVEC